MKLIRKVAEPQLAEITNCRACGLTETRRQVVLGRGFLPCQILYIGEAPGTSEDLLGEAFIGPSGKLLDRMMQDAELTAYTYYITNTCLCRPTDSKGGASRAPEPEEALCCRENVQRIITASAALVAVLIGKTAETYCADFFFPDRVFSILHPAYLLRQGGAAAPRYMDNVKTLEKVHAKLESLLCHQ